jgi:hypothetical protein
MRRLVPLVGLLAALVLAPVADAKFRISLSTGGPAPLVGQVFRFTLTTERGLTADEQRYGLRVVAVAPSASCSALVRSAARSKLDRCERKHMYTVIAKAVNNEPLARTNGWAIPIEHAAPTAWTGAIRFPRPGRWLLVVPNGPTVGYSIPPPVVRVVSVKTP